MKALKNNSTIYMEQIVSAITDCYAENAEPSNSEQMALYSQIGQSICEQGEKAFVVHLAQTLAEQLPQIKGFSPRNLRRMRDFFYAYENNPSLMEKAQALSWTQNTVILECCKTNEQRTFYINLAAEQNLSKLALMKAIESKAFESASDEETLAQNVTAVCTPVGNTASDQTVDTAQAVETACGAFVTACEPLRQGDGAPDNSNSMNSAEIGGIPKNRLDIYEADANQTEHRPIDSYQTHLPAFPALADKWKVPNQFPPSSPPTKQKNSLPAGRTLCEIKQRIPWQILKAA